MQRDIGLITRVIDTNVKQQRTPRIWKTKTEQVRTIQDLVNNVDGDVDTVIGYDNIDLDETSAILAPAPYVADKLDIEKDKIWSEFLRLIGISNMSFQKKERNISDEVAAMQGGTVASRYSRFEPRNKAIKMINEKFGTNIEVRFYDGLPDSNEKFEEYIEKFEDTENGGEEDD